jgi:hypothetical protein
MTEKKTTEEEVRDIGDRLELFVDPWLIGELNGTAVHRLHEPVPRNIALKTDAPWEGNRGGYITVFEDDGVFRMYYFAHHTEIVEESPGKYIENQEPLAYTGSHVEALYINFSSAAAGRIKVAIEDVAGGEVEGFGLADSVESIGDELYRRVYWKDGRRPGTLTGKPVRLRFDIKDADLFAIRFR